jgi:tetratricopeptide (TPR) repeat protein
LYEEAVRLDPNFVQAWARVSMLNSLIYSNGVPTRELRDAARQAAEKAISLGPDQPDGYLAMGSFYRLITLDVARAREEYQKGLKLAPGNPELLRGLGVADTQAGAWEEGLARLQEAARLDPRLVANVNSLVSTLLQMRRPREAREIAERSLEFAPANITAIENVAITHLAEGDLAAARASATKYGKPIAPSTLVAFFANYQDLVWVLDAGQMEIFNRLTLSDFDNNPVVWGICRAQARHFAGDDSGARDEAEKVLVEVDKQLKDTPDDPQLHENRGLALAFLGRKDEAIREGELGVKLGGPATDAVSGPYYLHQLVRIEILVGEHERALTHLEALMKMPYLITPAWLKIDPNFDPLRQNPRFQKLVAAAK